MKKLSLSALFVCTTLSMSQLTACQTPNTSQNQSQYGALKFQVAWPTESTGFKTQAIPDKTTKIEIHISGEKLDQPIIETLTRSGGDDKKIISLPEGRKVVKVSAMDTEGTVLALHTQTVTIKGGKNHQLIMDLEPLDQPSVEPSISPTPELKNPLTGGNNTNSTGSGLQPLPPNQPNPAPAPNPTEPANNNNPTTQPPPTNTTTPVNTSTTTTTTTTTTTSGSSNSSSSSSSSSSITSKTPLITSITPSNAAPGTTVTIVGTDLDGVSAVIFNNGASASTFSVNSNTEIIATLPATAISGPVTVSNGTNSSAFTGFSINHDLSKLYISEIFAHNDTATQRQYVKLKNLGNSTIDASGAHLYYTDEGGALAHYAIPVGSPQLPVGGELIISINTDPFPGGTNEIYTGDAGHNPMLSNLSQTTEVYLCKDSPCNDMVRYMAFGDSGGGPSQAVAIAAGLWSGTPEPNTPAITTITGSFNTTNFMVNNGLIFNSGDQVAIQTSSGERRERTINVANSTDITIISSLNETIQGSNDSDGNSNSGIRLNQTGLFSTTDQVILRDNNSVSRTVASVSSTRVQLTNPIDTDVDALSTGSGTSAAAGPILTNYSIAGTFPPIKTGDEVRLKTIPLSQAGHGITRQVTSANFNAGQSRHQILINNYFEKVDFQTNQLGTGSAVDLTMASLPTGFATNQNWGGQENKSFNVEGFAGNNVTLDNNLSECAVNGGSGNGNAGTPVIVSSCTVSGVMLKDGDRIVSNDSPLLGQAVNINSPGGITGTWPSGPINIVLQGPNFSAPPTATTLILAAPSGGFMELVPDGDGGNEDHLITIPKSGLLHLLPQGGFVKHKKSIVFTGAVTDIQLDNTYFEYGSPTL